jgi:ADP-ribose pyrophosphatase YjhB (NUDIX family)
MSKMLVDLVDEQELNDLRAHYGKFCLQHEDLAMEPGSLDFYRRAFKNRRGEILFVLRRDNGDVLLHTKHNYPEGLYRIPGGGIDWGEPVRKSLGREVFEETQLPVREEQFLGVLSYNFYCHQPADLSRKAADPVGGIPFVSYIFVVPGVAGEPIPEDQSEGISGFKWVPLAALAAVAAQLRALPSDDRGSLDWGRFRALGHDFVVENSP